MRAIFVSYRRDDSQGEAGRLFDDLVAVFGENSVFMDVAAIEVGRDFRKAIDDSVATCGVLLSIIGKGWIDAKNESGRRRLDDPADFVRLETASASFVIGASTLFLVSDKLSVRSSPVRNRKLGVPESSGTGEKLLGELINIV